MRPSSSSAIPRTWPIGQEMAELVIPPSLRERHREGLRRYLETGESRILGKRLELTGMRADGEEFPVELAVNRIAEADPPMFTGTIRDITARLQAQKEREEARGQLEAILQGVADAVTAQGPDGKLLFANEAAVKTLGFASTEELLNAPTATIMDRYDILDEDARPFPLEALPGRRALSGRGRARGDRALPRAGNRRGELVGRQGHADPGRGRQGDHGDQRDRGHQRAQARRDGPALPGPQRRGARLLARIPTSCSWRWQISRCRRWPTGSPWSL